MIDQRTVRTVIVLDAASVCFQLLWVMCALESLCRHHMGCCIYVAAIASPPLLLPEELALRNAALWWLEHFSLMNCCCRIAYRCRCLTGRFIVDPEKRLEIVAPDLEGFKVQYVVVRRIPGDSRRVDRRAMFVSFGAKCCPAYAGDINPP